MTVHLPRELEQFVQSQVLCGRFASEDDAIAEAVRLLRQRNQEGRPTAERLTEQEFEQRLLNAGFLASIPAEQAGSMRHTEFQPVAIRGEPLSETVIRERR